MDSSKNITKAHTLIDTEPGGCSALTPARLLLQGLIEGNVVLLEDWQKLDETARKRLLDAQRRELLLAMLVEAGLLTNYQASRVLAGGSIHHLVFGNYRLLDRLGVGGMGVVYRGEHILMRRPVAIKVLQSSADEDEVLLKRFSIEMRALARIRHPNIVQALDAGRRGPGEYETHTLHYLVMEYVVGPDLEEMVAQGPLSVARACELIYQIAGALEETQRHNLIHRDIKPSNILVTEGNVAKLLDFGLALHFGRRRLTSPGTLLGTLNYMAPEQAVDSANVDIRADIFGLGATLFFALTGKPPFSALGNITQQVASRLTQPAPELRSERADIPAKLEKIICRMMAHQRDERLPNPQSVMRALLPFINPTSHFAQCRPGKSAVIVMPDEAGCQRRAPSVPRVLVVDDEELVRRVCLSFFRTENFECHGAGNGAEALRMLAERPFDLVLLDIDMPIMSGTATLRQLRAQPPCDHLKIIMASGGVSADELAELLALGADDYLTKPLLRQELVARVKAALLHKATQDRTSHLNQQLLRLNVELEQALIARNGDLVHSRNALVFALAKIVEARTQETAGHLTRITRCAGILAQAARESSRLASVLDQPFLQTLQACALLHDIGNVAMPDHILQPSGALDSEDQIILQGHTTIGAETLKTVAKRDRSAAAFWQMAMDIARHHHEQFNGRGYPDGLSGNDIPLAARIVAVADAYETLRGPSSAGKHLTHAAAREVILKGSPGRFDPLLLKAFGESETEFDKVFRSCPDRDDTLSAPAGAASIAAEDQAGLFDATGLRICVEA